MVPEGLLPTLTLALVLAAQRMAKRNVLIRDLASVETLGFTTVICTDKTGTLTENRMRVRELLIGQRHCSASALPDQAELVGQHRDFFMAACFCHELKELLRSGGSVLLGDPMEIAIADMARAAFSGSIVSRRRDDIPFDADRRRQSVVQETPWGLFAYCKGALELVLPLCTGIAAHGGIRPLDDRIRTSIQDGEREMAAKGLRVLAFAAKELPGPWTSETLEDDLVFQGLVGMEDPPRPEVSEAIRKCGEAGIKVIVVTGDHPLTATAIAREIGLVRTASPRVITGADMQRLSDVRLRSVLEAGEIVFARVSPEQKMRVVRALIAMKHVVAATGDGVNDAPALKAAHIGIAMGIAGTDVAREAANMVLVDDNFASIVNAVEEGRAVFQNIRKFLTYVLVHNVAQLVPYLAFALFRIPLPLTPIQILFVDMGTDSLTALGLGVERPDPQGMRLPPHSQDERLLNLPLALRAYLFLGVIEAAAAMAAFFFVLVDGGWTYGGASRAERSALPAGDDGLPERHHRHADRQRLPVPKRSPFRLLDAAPRQPPDHRGHCARGRLDPGGGVRALGAVCPGNGRHSGNGVAVSPAVCAGDAGLGGAPEMDRPSIPPSRARGRGIVRAGFGLRGVAQPSSAGRITIRDGRLGRPRRVAGLPASSLRQPPGGWRGNPPPSAFPGSAAAPRPGRDRRAWCAGFHSPGRMRAR